MRNTGAGSVGAAIAGFALGAMAPAALAQTAVAPAVPTFRLGAAIGADIWPELGNLDPYLGGDFDKGGFALELSLHAGGWSVGPASVYLGADLGFLGNDSDVEGVVEGEDLQTSLIFFTPSVKAVFGSGRVHWTLDAGAGYYGTSVEEWEDHCGWDCDTHEYYDDSTIGAHVGLGAEFSLSDSAEGLRLSVGAKVHFVDFDEPTELAPRGSLDGPIYVLTVGVAFYP
jgi:outer membrane protein with beta-barrel domain